MEPKTYVLNIYVGTRKTRIQLSDDGQRRMQSTFKIKEEEKGARAQRLYVGSRVLRVEDTRLITGKDQFLDNLKFPNMVFAGFVRSPYPHAKIKNRYFQDQRRPERRRNTHSRRSNDHLRANSRVVARRRSKPPRALCARSEQSASRWRSGARSCCRSKEQARRRSRKR